MSLTSKNFGEKGIVDIFLFFSTAKLEDRITPRSAAVASETGGSAFNIRGMANRKGGDQGFAIKGTSAKELFPEKLGNAGKELFADKMESRGRRRQKAEDMFR